MPWFGEGQSSDTILIPVNPIERPGITQHGARDIPNRINEVSFNAVLLGELRVIALLRGWRTRKARGARCKPDARLIASATTSP